MKKTAVLLVMLSMLVVVVLSGCGKKSSDSGGGTAPPAANLSGTWKMTSTVTTPPTNTGCVTVGTLRNFDGTVSQTTGSNDFTVTETGAQEIGTISGTQVTLNGSNIPYIGGYLTSQANGSLVTSTTSSWTITGTSSWQWSQTSGGATYCSGSSSFSAICTTCTHT